MNIFIMVGQRKEFEKGFIVLKQIVKDVDAGKIPTVTQLANEISKDLQHQVHTETINNYADDLVKTQDIQKLSSGNRFVFVPTDQGRGKVQKQEAGTNINL